MIDQRDAVATEQVAYKHIRETSVSNVSVKFDFSKSTRIHEEKITTRIYESNERNKLKFINQKANTKNKGYNVILYA